MKIILVRHTETYGNVEKRFNGASESEFTPLGHKMNTLLCGEITSLNKKFPICHIYSSPRNRAKIVAEELSESLNIPLTVADELQEFNFGIFDGLTAEEAQKKDPELWDQWMKDYDGITLPGGDNFEEYYHRTINFCKIILSGFSDSDTILIISHGGTVTSLLMYLLDLPSEKRWHFGFPLGGIAIIDYIEKYGILRSLYTPEYNLLS